MTYDYALPGCVAAAVACGDTVPLSRHVEELAGRASCAWLNLAVTHDGISLRPWAPAAPVESLRDVIARATENGLHVEHRRRAGGTEPYEIDAFPADLARRGEARASVVTLANVVLLTLRGAPLLYIPAVLGECAQRSAVEPRDAVRGRIRGSALPRPTEEAAVGSPVRLMALRTSEPALAASAPMRLTYNDSGLLVYERGQEGVVTVALNFSRNVRPFSMRQSGYELITGARAAGVVAIAPRCAKVFLHAGSAWYGGDKPHSGRGGTSVVRSPER